MTRPPNILLVTSDQQHHSALGVHTPVLQTPHLDALGAGGLRYDRAYCNNPLCSPSRSTMITGLYPSWHGCWTLGTKLDEDVRTVGEQFSAAGYATSLIGKAHFQPLATAPEQTSLEAQPLLRDLDFWREFHGPFYGFDHIELARNHADESHVGQHYAIWMQENGLPNWRDHFRSYPPVPDEPIRRHTWDLPAEYHYSTWTAERSIAQIEQAVAADQPFFTWASFHDPHPPYLVPEPYASMYDPADVEPGSLTPGELDAMAPWFGLTQDENPDFSEWQETAFANHGFGSHLVEEKLLRQNIAIYYGMISFLDAQFGRILAALDRLGVADDTIVVFTSDHGHFLGQHGLTAKGPFHYEDLLRVPFLVRWPGRIAPGRVTEGLLGLIDLSPTLLSASGLPVPGAMQGVDQTPVWRGQAASVQDHVIVENRHQPSAVHLRTLIEDRYKMTLYGGRPWGDLFDLQEDPGEVRNRFADPAYRGVRDELAL
ncbi:MAG TPA: sulfatase-like hydrolase/transferase, partial [Mycobacteriales bacterium]|nr:sulfatase-like hydrolase/transferase [Mycobacteriales bacterium]